MGSKLFVKVNDMLLKILGMLDILCGIMIIYPFHGVAALVAILILLKGLISIISSAASKWYFDYLGWIDVIAALLILLNINFVFFAALPILKGLYSIIV